MRKYLAYIRANIQFTLTYRGSMIIWLAANFISLAVISAVWLSSSGAELLGGYTRPELITYAIVSLFIQWLTGWFPFYGVRDEIKNGNIVGNSLVKPVSYYWQKFSLDFGWHIVSVWFGVVATLIALIIFRSHLSLVFIPDRIFLFSLSLILSIFITFGMSLCLGMIAFWTTHVGAIDSIFWIGRVFLGGQGLPISFIPKIFLAGVYILPFRYMFSLPLEIYFGKLTNNEIISGFLVGIVWALLFSILYKIMWDKGRLRYTSFGN